MSFLYRSVHRIPISVQMRALDVVLTKMAHYLSQATSDLSILFKLVSDLQVELREIWYRSVKGSNGAVDLDRNRLKWDDYRDKRARLEMLLPAIYPPLGLQAPGMKDLLPFETERTEPNRLSRNRSWK
jgi:hypothetical protein